MNFSTPSRVLTTIRAGDEAEWERGSNRVKINNAANCVPPLDLSLAKQMGIKINVNWGELMMLLANARRQLLRAYWGSQYLFNIGLPLAPAEYQQDWQLFLTDQINRKIKDKLRYFQAWESMASAVVCHGLGPRSWFDPYKWCADYVAIEDLRIPTDTTLDMEDLEWYAIRKMYTPGELAKKAFAPNSRWQKKIIAKMLKNKKSQNWDYAANNYDWESQPEKLAELVKQDGGYYMGDALPRFPFWHFYFKDDSFKDERDGWYMRVVPAEGAQDTQPDKFLWESQKPVAKTREQLITFQYGDLSNKSPFMYHSVRSLGFALLEPTFYTNLTRCRMLQHLHDQFNIWLRSTDPADKARAMVQEFANFGVVKPGLSIVPQTERHQVDPQLIEMGMAQLRQLMQESSASYTQSTDPGTKREQTAFETSVKVEQVNAMLGGILTKSFIYEKPHYVEICRRFTVKQPLVEKGGDQDIIDVQQACAAYGIPRKYIDNVKHWIVEPVTPLGMGNPVLARASAKELLEVRPLLDPTAQQEALHEIVLTFTNDPRKAARWVPIGKNRGITDAQRDAQAIFGTLMQGVPVPPREGLSPIDQFEAMRVLFAGKITLLTQRDNMATRDEASGLAAVQQYLTALLQQLSQNPAEKQRVKQYGDSLGKLVNEAKALIQRGAQAQQQQGNGQDRELEAKIQAMVIQAHAKAKATADKAAQNQQHKEKAFVREQRRQDAATFSQIQRDNEAAKAKNRMASMAE